MAVDIENSFDEVVRAMKNLTEAFEQRILDLKKMGRDEGEIKTLTQGAMAMRDSSGIYLAWARHFMSKLGEVEGLNEDEESGIIEE